MHQFDCRIINLKTSYILFVHDYHQRATHVLDSIMLNFLNTRLPFKTRCIINSLILTTKKTEKLKNRQILNGGLWLYSIFLGPIGECNIVINLVIGNCLEYNISRIKFVSTMFRAVYFNVSNKELETSLITLLLFNVVNHNYVYM